MDTTHFSNLARHVSRAAKVSGHARVDIQLGARWNCTPFEAKKRRLRITTEIRDILDLMANDAPALERHIADWCEAMADVPVVVDIRDLRRLELVADCAEDLAQGHFELDPSPANRTAYRRSLAKQAASSAALARSLESTEGRAS